MTTWHAGAKVQQQNLPKSSVLPREQLDTINFTAKHEAYRFALANRKRSWAKRWLRSEGKR